MPSYHIIITADRTIMGVYGTYLKAYALERLEEYQRAEPWAGFQVLTVQAEQAPHVGDTWA